MQHRQSIVLSLEGRHQFSSSLHLRIAKKAEKRLGGDTLLVTGQVRVGRADLARGGRRYNSWPNAAQSIQPTEAPQGFFPSRLFQVKWDKGKLTADERGGTHQFNNTPGQIRRSIPTVPNTFQGEPQKTAPQSLRTCYLLVANTLSSSGCSSRFGKSKRRLLLVFKKKQIFDRRESDSGKMDAVSTHMDILHCDRRLMKCLKRMREQLLLFWGVCSLCLYFGSCFFSRSAWDRAGCRRLASRFARALLSFVTLNLGFWEPLVLIF